MSPSSSDSESYDDGYMQTEKKVAAIENDLHGIKERKVVPLNISPNYVSNWTPKQAFREMYQNWRDALLRKNSLRLSDFKLVYKENPKAREIFISLPKPGSKNGEILGYIRFKWKKEWDDEQNTFEELGTLEITNFNDSLQRSHLRMGETTKEDDPNQTGQHGEGMKLGIAIFLRFPACHHVRCLTGGYYLNFQLDCDMSVECKFTLPKKSTVSENKNKAKDLQAKGEPRENKARIWEDVCFEIGHPKKVKDKKGDPAEMKKIRLNDFREWLTVTIDIQPPKDMVSTPSGDLILDEQHKNKLYLRGLLLQKEGSVSTNSRFRYSYNFCSGETGRDRMNIGNAHEEARLVADIWDEALTQNNSLVCKYVDMLMAPRSSHIPDINSLKYYRYPDTARLVWTELLERAKGKNGQYRFYYKPSRYPGDKRLIEDCLKCTAVPLSRELWEILRHYTPCRTAHEERNDLFINAQVVPAPMTKFSDHMMRSLKACLASDSLTKDVELAFVEGGTLGIDVLYSQLGKQFKIHSKWLTYEGAHEDGFCDHSMEEENLDLPTSATDSLTCDDAVLSLWGIMVDELSEHDKEVNSIAAFRRQLKKVAHVKLPLMPRAIVVRKTWSKGELEVSWKSAERHVADGSSKVTILVTLHKDVCDIDRAELLYRECECECPAKEVHLSRRRALFTGLDPASSYFPMVSRKLNNAFYGVRPEPIKPAARNGTYTINLSSESDGGIDDDGMDQAPSTPETAGQTVDSDFAIFNSHSPAPPAAHSGHLSTNITGSGSAGLSTSQTKRSPDNGRASTFLPDQATNHRPPLTYTPGAPVPLAQLPLATGFPGSHDWFRTLEYPDEDVFIGKPNDKMLVADPKLFLQNKGVRRKRTPDDHETDIDSLYEEPPSSRRKTRV